MYTHTHTHTHTHIYIYIYIINLGTDEARPVGLKNWPLQDIVSLQSFIVGVYHPFIASPHMQSLPYCSTTARPLRNIRPPTDLSFLCHTPYNIGDGNIVLRPIREGVSVPSRRRYLYVARTSSFPTWPTLTKTLLTPEIPRKENSAIF